MTLWLKRAACATALVALLSAAAGCAKKQDEPKSSTPAAEKAEKTEIPEELMTQGARLFGAPFEREVHMKMTYSTEPGETQQYFVYRDAKVSLKEGVAVVTSKLVNAPTGLDKGETAELRRDGVWMTSVAGARLESPFLAMPAEVSEGSKWSYEVGIDQSKVHIDVVDVRKETIKVPLGEFEAWRIESKGTIQGPAVNGVVRDVTHYVEGIGVVRAETETTRSASGADGKPMKTTVKLLLEAIPEP